MKVYRSGYGLYGFRQRSPGKYPYKLGPTAFICLMFKGSEYPHEPMRTVHQRQFVTQADRLAPILRDDIHCYCTLDDRRIGLHRVTLFLATSLQVANIEFVS